MCYNYALNLAFLIHYHLGKNIHLRKKKKRYFNVNSTRNLIINFTLKTLYLH